MLDLDKYCTDTIRLQTFGFNSDDFCQNFAAGKKGTLMMLRDLTNEEIMSEIYNLENSTFV